MSKFFDAVRAGLSVAAENPPPIRYMVDERPVVCPHCGHDRFVEGKAQLNTAVLTFFKLDWMNRSAAILVCAECGRLEWFLQQPDAVE